MSLRIEALSRHTLTRRELDRVTLEVPSGEFLALLGSPGSGRAALLRVLAGLEEADSGRILLDGRDITRLPPRRRGIGYPFRHDPLFGHPTVFEAVAAALPEAEEDGAAPPDPAATAARVEHLLALTGLRQDGGWMPAMLPPRKRHRLALARVLAAGPRVLLLGEGFDSLGAGPRPPARHWLLDLHRRLGLTTLLVARDAAEALALGDRIAVLNAGRLEQVASPAELQARPATGYVAQLLGGGAGAMRGDGDAPWVPGRRPGPAAETVEVVEARRGVPARVLSSTPFGATLRLELELLSDGSQVEAEVPSLGTAPAPLPGSIIGLRLRRPPPSPDRGGLN